MKSHTRATRLCQNVAEMNLRKMIRETLPAESYGVLLQRQVWHWGAEQTQPTCIESLERVVSVGCGMAHCLVVTADGSAFSWGRGEDGQLGREMASIELDGLSARRWCRMLRGIRHSRHPALPSNSCPPVSFGSW